MVSSYLLRSIRSIAIVPKKKIDSAITTYLFQFDNDDTESVSSLVKSILLLILTPK